MKNAPFAHSQELALRPAALYPVTVVAVDI